MAITNRIIKYGKSKKYLKKLIYVLRIYANLYDHINYNL